MEELLKELINVICIGVVTLTIAMGIIGVGIIKAMDRNTEVIVKTLTQTETVSTD